MDVIDGGWFETTNCINALKVLTGPSSVPIGLSSTLREQKHSSLCGPIVVSSKHECPSLQQSF